MSSQPIVEALASLRDSLARLTQRSFDDFALFQSVTSAQFRSGETARRLALALAGGQMLPGDDGVAMTALTAGGKVAVAEPMVHATVVVAVDAANAALVAIDHWLAEATAARIA